VRLGLPGDIGGDSRPAPGGPRAARSGDLARAPRPGAAAGGGRVTNPEATDAGIQAPEALGLPHMLVGGRSRPPHRMPRASHAADVVLQLEGAAIGPVTERLGPGFQLDPQMSFEGVTGTYRYTLHVAECPFTIELFLLGDDPHDRERFRRRRRVAAPQGETFLPTAEDVIVTKLRWSLLGKRKE